MDTATELHARTELHHAHPVAILLAEEGDGAELLCLLDRHVAVVLKRNVLTDHIVDEALHAADFLIGDLLEMCEVETQRVRGNERSLLLHVVAQHLLQGVVEKVGGSMVGGACLTLVGIHTRHEVGLDVLRQFLHDMHRLVVLALRVGDVDCLVTVYEHSGVAHLSSHLAVERSEVEHKLIV